MSNTRKSLQDKKAYVTSSLNQVIDLIQEDISGSATRRKYQTFVTGGLGPGVTSSLYQTVYDQDFTLQTSNPVMDMTVGLFHFDDGTNTRPNLVTKGTGYSRSTTTGQLNFHARSTMMMREKVNIYRQYAAYLLGDPDDAFCLDTTSYPSLKDKVSDNASTGTDFATLVQSDTTVIDAALFVNVKRLFKRDGIRKETFALRTYKNAPAWDTAVTPANWTHHYTTAGALATESNTTARKNNVLGTTVQSSEYGVQIIADIGGNSDKSDTERGEVARLKLASDSTKTVGLLFYQAGIAVLNLGGSSALSGLNQAATGTGNNIVDTGLGQDTATHGIQAVYEQRDPMYGIIAGMDDGTGTDAGSIGAKTTGQVYLGVGTQQTTSGLAVSSRQTAGTGPATFYPDLLVSASIDDIVDHIGYTRFSSGSLTGIAFQNQTKINSSIYFCRAEANEFNTSPSNPTWGDSTGKGVMLQDADDKAFTYITTVCLHDGSGEVVAVAKLNRPIEKNEESEVTIRVRLDF